MLNSKLSDMTRGRLVHVLFVSLQLRINAYTRPSWQFLIFSSVGRGWNLCDMFKWLGSQVFVASLIWLSNALKQPHHIMSSDLDCLIWKFHATEVSSGYQGSSGQSPKLLAHFVLELRDLMTLTFSSNNHHE